MKECSGCSGNGLPGRPIDLLLIRSLGAPDLPTILTTEFSTTTCRSFRRASGRTARPCWRTPGVGGLAAVSGSPGGSGAGRERRSDLDAPACEDQNLPRDFGPYELGRNRPGRHGRGLQGAAKGPGPHRGREDDPGHAPGLAGTHPPLPGRGLGRRPLAARQHHADPRRRPHHGQHYFTMEYVEGESLAHGSHGRGYRQTRSCDC